MKEKWAEKANKQDEQWKMREDRAEEAGKQDEKWESRAEEREKQEGKWESRAEEREKQEEKWESRVEEREKQEGKWESRAEEREEQEGKWESRAEDRKRQKEKRKKQFHLTGSVTAKITAFFLLAISFFAGAGAGILCIHLAREGFYTRDLDTVLSESLWGEGRDAIYQVESLLNQGLVKAAGEYCAAGNIDIELAKVNEEGSLEVIWSTWDGKETDLTGILYSAFDRMDNKVTVNGHTLENEIPYLYRYYIDPEFPVEDDCREMAELVTFFYNAKFALIALAAGGLFLCLICFIFLMCSAGHRNGQEGIVPGVLTGIHLDVLTLFFGGMASGICAIAVEIVSGMDNWGQIILLPAFGSMLAVWATLYCMEFALRLKMGKCWRHSLIYVTFRGIGRMLRFLGRETGNLIRGIPMMLTVLTVYFGILILEFMGIVFVQSGAGPLFWFLEKLVLLVAVMYIAQICNKLLTAGRALAEGEEGYAVDTVRMFGRFKEHGENLNSLSRGISRAVAERMKSEHLKTELISNVSHDLKTPLTSIINYADLICEEAGKGEEADIPRLKEFAEVLLRQSGRLKKLLEDLMEASKATTGNLEVNLESCEAGVLLSQAVGEYQQRMEEKGLELVTRRSREEVWILADGRHLWRVFDNLLNNICKYAQENSRVYLSIETDEEKAKIIFRNMSKYELDISPEELQERFVRGDKSRHMEGNGLGLSIAGSLVELQNGEMDIVIDGDLFKVALSFPLQSRESQP